MKDINTLIDENQGKNLNLFHNINSQLAKVLTTIGFDKNFVKAQGVSLFEENGQEYYDFLSGYGVFALGRNHPKIKKAIKDALDQDYSSLVQMDAPLLSGLLAEKLIQTLGHGVRDTVFFTNSGTEAVEGALKFSKAATKRNKFLCLNHAFHGLTLGSLSVNGNAEFKNGFGELLPCDTLPLNDLDLLEQRLKSEQYAAFIFEPIQGKGVYIPENNFLQEAVKLCKKYGTISIADEVQTGLGRTGKWLACEHFDIEPDITTIAKALGGGFIPIGALVYRRDIYDKVFTRMDRCVVHSNTFGKNSLAMICGLTTLKLIEEENILQHTINMGDKFAKNLSQLKEKYDWIKEIRHKGLMFGIEFKRPDSFKGKMAWDAAHKLDKGLFAEMIVMQLMAKHHILTQVSGHHQDIIKLLPPLIINETHINHFTQALDTVLSDCGKIGGPIIKMAANLAKHAVKSS
ncbi:MAG: aspartate aminotransferase family protein [bacterium]|nr:aspartate aminotransferase family protein [bacterium]MBU1918018.1 aspartate aminotransferase family protein [bacterium]